MRSRAPPTTPTLAGPTQQHQLDLGPSNHALRRTRNAHALSRTRRDPPRHHTDVAPLAARPASSRYTTKIRIPHTPSHAPRIADSNGTRQVTNEHTLLACTTVRCTDTRAHRASQTPNFTSHYVVHHLDVCTVTALNDKQAFSDSIANRGRELSRGPKHRDCAFPTDALYPRMAPCATRRPSTL